MWGSFILILGAVAFAGVIVWKIDGFFEYLDKKKQADLEWELKKYKKQ